MTIERALEKEGEALRTLQGANTGENRIAYQDARKAVNKLLGRD